MVLGYVVAASARENLQSILQRLPEHPMAFALTYYLKILVAEVEKSETEKVVDASWATLAAGEDPKREE